MFSKCFADASNCATQSDSPAFFPWGSERYLLRIGIPMSHPANLVIAESMTKGVLALRPEHNYSTPTAIRDVARAHYESTSMSALSIAFLPRCPDPQLTSGSRSGAVPPATGG